MSNVINWIFTKILDAIDPAQEVPKIIPHVNKVREDLESPNLFVGKIIEDSNIKCEVVELHKTNMKVKILEIKWDRLGTYLDVGNVYPVHMHDNSIISPMQIWEIAPKHMKRSTSQVLLAWDEGIGWCWDLDF